MPWRECTWTERSRFASRVNALSKDVFEVGGKIGPFVAILHDDRRVDAEAQGFSGFGGDGAGAGDDDCARGNDERSVGGRLEDGVVREVVNRSAAGEDDSRSKDGACTDDCAFVNSGVAADENVIFDDDGGGVDWLQHP